jgi:hypothetical protein
VALTSITCSPAASSIVVENLPSLDTVAPMLLAHTPPNASVATARLLPSTFCLPNHIPRVASLPRTQPR